MNWRIFLILLWFGAYCLVSLAAYQRAEPGSGTSALVAAGGTFSAVGLLAVWFSFGTSPFVLRAGVALVGVLALSGMLCIISQAREAAPRFWLAFHGVEFAVVAGIFQVFHLFGLRLNGPAEIVRRTEMKAARQQYSLATLMLIVGGVAMLLAGLRFLFRDQPGIVQLVPVASAFGGIGVLVVSLVFVRGMIVQRCLAAVVLVNICVAGESTAKTFACVSTATIGRFYVVMLLFTATSLVVFRVCGYRLERMPKAFDAFAPPPATPAESRL